ncbi:MAG: hypothetical protein ACTS73_04005 [Arsenophonus sp. NEOnobi-MAG3]
MPKTSICSKDNSGPRVNTFTVGFKKLIPGAINGKKHFNLPGGGYTSE